MVYSTVFRTVLLEKPDVVVGTPSRVLTHLRDRVGAHCTACAHMHLHDEYWASKRRSF